MKRSIILTAFFFVCILGWRSSTESLLPDYLARAGLETGRKNVLFLMAHFDDDSTIAGTMNLYVRSGWDTHVCWLTRAGLGGMWGDPWFRTEEANRAMDAVGIPKDNRHILGIGDHECMEHFPEIMDRVTGLVQEIQPSVIIHLAYEGGHPDHDTTPLAAYVAAQRVGCQIVFFEVPTYNTSGPKVMPYRVNGFVKSYGPWTYVPLDREAKKAKKGDRYANRSQWFFMYPFGILGTWRSIQGKGEPIRPTPEYDFLQPPHPGKLLYQRRQTGVAPDMPFSDWQEAVRTIPEFREK